MTTRLGLLTDCSGKTKTFLVLSVNWRHIRLIDLVSANGKTKVSWLISFPSLIRRCFNILIRHCNPSRIRNIKIERSKQLYHNNTLPLFSPLPKLGQWMWHQLTKRVKLLRCGWPGQYGLQLKISIHFIVFVFTFLITFPRAEKNRKLGHDWRLRSWVELSRIGQCEHSHDATQLNCMVTLPNVQNTSTSWVELSWVGSGSVNGA